MKRGQRSDVPVAQLPFTNPHPKVAARRNSEPWKALPKAKLSIIMITVIIIATFVNVVR